MADDESWKQGTNHILNALYPQRSHSQTSIRSEQPLTKRHKSESQIQRSHYAVGLMKSGEIKHMQIKKQDHTLLKIVCIVSLLFLLIFAFDARNDIEKEKHRLQLQGKHCFEAYTQNQCDNPVEAMRQKCKQYQICYSTPPQHKIRLSKVFGGVVGEAASHLMKSAGLAGAVFLTVIVIAVLFFAYKSGKGTMILKKS